MNRKDKTIHQGATLTLRSIIDHLKRILHDTPAMHVGIESERARGVRPLTLIPVNALLVGLA